jgi:hypothetical protein
MCLSSMGPYAGPPTHTIQKLDGGKSHGPKIRANYPAGPEVGGFFVHNQLVGGQFFVLFKHENLVRKNAGCFSEHLILSRKD